MVVTAHFHITQQTVLSHTQAHQRLKYVHISAGTGITVTDGVIATTITQYTDADVPGAISVSGDSLHDPATGVISTQGLASSTTDDSSEGSNAYRCKSRCNCKLQRH